MSSGLGVAVLGTATLLVQSGGAGGAAAAEAGGKSGQGVEELVGQARSHMRRWIA